jgi:glycosyltransferase involved in cell wall biosynthesis
MAQKLFLHQVLVSPRVGGAEHVAIDIHKHSLERWAGSSELLVPTGSETQKRVESESLRYRTYHLDRILGRNRFASVIANLDLLRTLRGSSGLLHIHSPFVFGALRPLLAISRLKTILHIHLDYAEQDLEWPLRQSPDLVIVCAKFMEKRVARLLASNKRKPTKVAVEMNAVDTQKFTPGDREQAKRECGVDPARPVLLMAANLAPHKGQETAIRAVSALVAKGIKPVLWLVGEERQSGEGFRNRLQALVKELALEDFVSFLGFRRDVPKLLHAADFFLLPSTQEGLPLSILEAQASRVVVLAAPTAGIPEVIENGRTGFLLAADDAKAYAQTLVSLLDNAELRQTVTEAAYRQVLSNFTLKKYCDSVLGRYEELLHGT